MTCYCKEAEFGCDLSDVSQPLIFSTSVNSYFRSGEYSFEVWIVVSSYNYAVYDLFICETIELLGIVFIREFFNGKWKSLMGAAFILIKYLAKKARPCKLWLEKFMQIRYYQRQKKEKKELGHFSWEKSMYSMLRKNLVNNNNPQS